MTDLDWAVVALLVLQLGNLGVSLYAWRVARRPRPPFGPVR